MQGELRFLPLSDPMNPLRTRRLAYREWGDPSRRNTVVCVHGLSRNSRDFDFLARALSARYHIIVPDMAGRGQSDPFSNPALYNYGTYVADCTLLLNALHLPSVAWVGTSMGGIIGMMLAAQAPVRVKALVLNDVGSVVLAAGLIRIMGYVGAKERFETAAVAMEYIKTILATFGASSEAEWQQLFDASFNALPDGGYALAYDPAISIPLREAAAAVQGPLSDIDLSAVWQHVFCPALILRGEHSDILSRATAEAMRVRAAPTELVEIKTAGHAPALMSDDQIRVIADWLDRLA